MAIDPLSEPTFSFSQAARRLPRLRNNKPVHASTLWRWARVGLHGVRLETARVGGVQVTSDAALRRFFEGLAQAESAGASTPEPGRRAAEIEAELDAAGLGPHPRRNR